MRFQITECPGVYRCLGEHDAILKCSKYSILTGNNGFLMMVTVVRFTVVGFTVVGFTVVRFSDYGKSNTNK